MMAMDWKLCCNKHKERVLVSCANIGTGESLWNLGQVMQVLILSWIKGLILTFIRSWLHLILWKEKCICWVVWHRKLCVLQIWKHFFHDLGLKLIKSIDQLIFSIVSADITNISHLELLKFIWLSSQNKLNILVVRSWNSSMFLHQLSSCLLNMRFKRL